MESVENVWIDAVSYFTLCEPCTWGHLYVKKWILFNPAYISLDEMKAALSAEWVREKVKVNRGKHQRLLYEWPASPNWDHKLPLEQMNEVNFQLKYAATYNLFLF